ncbi:hypothetical protein [Paenibacillus sp. FSL M7-1046]|uniref:hypothetical protein n=1 Tax=Paenibacillus sp. FSL M7-1046 TaxID=2975315 RepID=UPI0030FCE6B2
MRGIKDSGFKTQAINEDMSLSEGEKVDAKVRLMGQVIRDQKQILADVLGMGQAFYSKRYPPSVCC